MKLPVASSRLPVALSIMLCVLLCAARAFAEKKPVAPVVTDELTAYLLPDAEKLKCRDLQLEWAEREAANQTMLVTVEKNKARQDAITMQIRAMWLDYARAKGIDLNLWEPDAKELKFVKKKLAEKAVTK